MMITDQFHHLGPTNQFQLLAPTKQVRNPYLNQARVSNEWLTSTNTSYYHPPPPPPQFRDGYKPVLAPRTNETIKKPMSKQCKIVKQMVNEYEDLILPPPPQFRDRYKPVPAPRTDKSQKQPRRLPPGGPKTGHFISRWQSELIVQEKQKAQKSIRRPPQRPPPPPTRQTKYDYPFNYDDDIFQTENESLGKFKIISTCSIQNKKFKSSTNEFKVKIFKKIGRC